MRKYTWILVAASLLTGVLMVVGDMAYAKYLDHGSRIRATLVAVKHARSEAE